MAQELGAQVLTVLLVRAVCQIQITQISIVGQLMENSEPTTAPAPGGVQRAFPVIIQQLPLCNFQMRRSLHIVLCLPVSKDR